MPSARNTVRSGGGKRRIGGEIRRRSVEVAQGWSTLLGPSSVTDPHPWALQPASAATGAPARRSVVIFSGLCGSCFCDAAGHRAPLQLGARMGPPLFIHLLTRSPAIGLFIFIAIPVSLGFIVAPSLSLSQPLEGWRMRDHETAEALDALILASTEAGPSTLPAAVRENLTSIFTQRRRLDSSSSGGSGNNVSRGSLHVNALPLPWSGAQAYCALFGGALASIESAEDNAEVLTALKNSDFLEGPYAWLGGTDSALEGTWKWTDGRTFSQVARPVDGAYANWNRGEPNDWGDGEDCMQMTVENGQWNDQSCYVHLGSVCRGGDFPPSPPSLSVSLQTHNIGTVRLVVAPASSAPSGSILTARGVMMIARVEDAVTNLLDDLCQVDAPPEAAVDNATENAPGVGGFGGSCTCPSGVTYQVGDQDDGCASLACVGGSSGTCNRHDGPWSRRRVVCTLPPPPPPTAAATDEITDDAPASTHHCITPHSITNLFRVPPPVGATPAASNGVRDTLLCNYSGSGATAEAAADACVQRRVHSAAFVERTYQSALGHQSDILTFGRFMQSANSTAAFLDALQVCVPP